MSKTVPMHRAKTHLSRLVAEALDGADIIISRGNRPAVRLVPVVPAASRRVFGAMKDSLTVEGSFFDELPEDELSAWEGA